jgi:secondary thiamine-phosphate synthase enzyme
VIHEIEVTTRVREEFVDVTAEVARAIAATGVRSGMAFVFCPHTTAAVTINENADPDVRRDVLSWASKTVPRNTDWRHAEGNSDAHVKVVLTGSCQPIPVRDGRPVLGTWQGVFLCEYDGPRARRLIVKVMEG